MSTLDDLRAVVRIQTQTTSAELPDVTIDWYLQQAYERTINGENQWPFFEQTWDLSLAIGASSMPLPGDVNLSVVMALFDVESNFRLTQVASEWADDHYCGPQVGTMNPIQFAIWNGMIELYPRVNLTVERAYRLRGYRRAVTWLTPTNEPDCDARLQLPLVHYAVALAYAQQEDSELELSYMDRWQRDAEAARRAIMDPRHHRPLTMAGSIDTMPVAGPSWVLVPPTP